MSVQIAAEESFSTTAELVERFYLALTEDDTLDVDSDSMLLNQLTDFHFTTSQLASTTDDDTLAKESAIWKLLMQLLDFEQAQITQNQSLGFEDFDSQSFLSPEEAVANLSEHDTEYNQAKVILSWLEEQACSSSEMKNLQPGSFRSIMHYRENTMDSLTRPHSVKHLSENMQKNGLNPDFPYQNSDLWQNEIDKNDDAQLSQLLWKLLKAGQMDEIKNILTKCDQHWRWVVYFKESGSITSEAVKAFGWTVQNEVDKSGFKMNEYDEAIYALNVSGNVGKALKVCKTWQDRLWVHLKVFCDIKEQTYVKEKVSSFDIYGFDQDDDESGLNLKDDELEELGNAYWNQELGSIQDAVENAISGNTIDSYGTLVRGIINKDTELLVKSLSSKEFPVRFALHIGLIDQKIFNNFILNYCKKLVGVLTNYTKKSGEIVSNFVEQKIPVFFRVLPFYIAKIEDQEELLHQFGILLSLCGNEQTRDDVIEMGIKYGIDVHEATAKVVDCMRKDPSKSDQEKIDTVDLLLMHVGQRLEATRQINSLVRGFILEGKPDLARKALEKLPEDTIPMLQEQDEDVEKEELLALILYKNAIEAFEEFHVIKSRPDSSDKDSQLFLNGFKGLVEDILNYPYGWLVPNPGSAKVYDKIENEMRSQQLAAIRKLVLPEFVLLLLNGMVSVGRVEDCLEYMPNLVRNQEKLKDCFEKETWQNVNKIVQQALLKTYENC